MRPKLNKKSGSYNGETNIKFMRIKTLKDIRKYHDSTMSCTWGSGEKLIGSRRVLMSPSRQTKNDPRYILYCTEKDWIKAFKLNG